MKPKPMVLVVDDETEVRNFFFHFLNRIGCESQLASTGKEVQALLTSRFSIDLALVDLKLPDTDGIQLLQLIRQVHPACPVIIMTGYSTVRSAVEAIRLGAHDYLDKPFDDLVELRNIITQALASKEQPSQQSPASYDFPDFPSLITQSPAMLDLLRLSSRLAPKDLTILIHGETGSGKEVFSRFIHHCSRRREQRFLAVNCGAFSESLLASELFGHEKGAFTGATTARRGIFEVADQGTLLLDEVAEASPGIQVKLLRVLETGEFFRVGGEHPLHSRARILAATHVNLEERVQQGGFREDLFYRLDVVRLTLPPLRERIEDIPLLAAHFLQHPRTKTPHGFEAPPAGRSELRLSPEAAEVLQAYSWPGNVRELANVVSLVAATCPHSVIRPEDLPDKLRSARKTHFLSPPFSPSSSSQFPHPTPHDSLSGSEMEGQTFVTAPSLPTTVPTPADTDIEVSPPGRQWADSVTDAIMAQLKSALTTFPAGQPLDFRSLFNEFESMLNNFSRDLIDRTLEKTKGDRAQAAQLLGLTPRQLHYAYREKQSS